MAVCCNWIQRPKSRVFNTGPQIELETGQCQDIVQTVPGSTKPIWLEGASRHCEKDGWRLSVGITAIGLLVSYLDKAHMLRHNSLTQTHY